MDDVPSKKAKESTQEIQGTQNNRTTNPEVEYIPSNSMNECLRKLPAPRLKRIKIPVYDHPLYKYRRPKSTTKSKDPPSLIVSPVETPDKHNSTAKGMMDNKLPPKAVSKKNHPLHSAKVQTILILSHTQIHHIHHH